MATEKQRTRISTGNIYEQRVGYSRAIKVGDYVIVGGTTALTSDGTIVGVDDPYAQAIQALQTIEWALGQAGATMADTVRYRIYLTSTDHIAEVSRALYETFNGIRPANTLIAGVELADERMLVEIEVDAIIGSASAEES